MISSKATAAVCRRALNQSLIARTVRSVSDVPQKAAQETTSSAKPKFDGNMSRVNHWSTRFALLYFNKTKRYKSMADVPDLVPHNQVENARSRLRIFLNLCLIVLGLGVSVSAIIINKRHVASGGITWVESNMLKHDKFKREYQEEQKAKAASAAAENNAS